MANVQDCSIDISSCCPPQASEQAFYLAPSVSETLCDPQYGLAESQIQEVRIKPEDGGKKSNADRKRKSEDSTTVGKRVNKPIKPNKAPKPVTDKKKPLKKRLKKL